MFRRRAAHQLPEDDNTQQQEHTSTELAVVGPRALSQQPRMLILCASYPETQFVQHEQAAPILRRMGALPSVSGRWYTPAGYSVEFLSVRSERWEQLANVRNTVVVPFYRYSRNMPHALRLLIDGRLRVLQQAGRILIYQQMDEAAEALQQLPAPRHSSGGKWLQ